jgi:hypothetical protein
MSRRRDFESMPSFSCTVWITKLADLLPVADQNSVVIVTWYGVFNNTHTAAVISKAMVVRCTHFTLRNEMICERFALRLSSYTSKTG